MTALHMKKAAHLADAAASKATTSHKIDMSKIHDLEQQDKGKAAADSQEERISFTLFSKAAGILTKRMKLAAGQLVKDASECRMSKGRAETVTLAPAQFGAFLQGLKPNQAIAHGICGHSKVFIVSKAKETGVIPAYGWPSIARTKEHFRYPEGPGLLMLDHDKARANSAALDDKALQSYSPDRLAEIISSFFPEIIHAAHVSACSTSSCIYNTETGEELRGKGAGFHLYLFLKNAVDAPRFLAVLGKRLVLAGYGPGGDQPGRFTAGAHPC